MESEFRLFQIKRAQFIAQFWKSFHKRFGFKGELKYCLSFSDKQESRVYYPNLRRHVEGFRD